MPAWSELVDEIQKLRTPESKNKWIWDQLHGSLDRVSKRRNGRNVILYGSAFLQKQSVHPSNIMITGEDINGFMTLLHGMDCSKGLTLILHSPGGQGTATQSIVDYLHSKFTDIEVIVPTYAMSAGTMISLGANRIVMGKQSQLGPIDPQLPLAGRSVSALAIIDQFEVAKTEIIKDQRLAAAWAVPLQSFGYGLLQEAKMALQFSKDMVKGWLEKRMLSSQLNPVKIAEVVSHFSDSKKNKNHGRRIGRDECRKASLIIEDLEADSQLQDDVLTAYHLMTIAFEQTALVKIITGNCRRNWLKHIAVQPTP